MLRHDRIPVQPVNAIAQRIAPRSGSLPRIAPCAVRRVNRRVSD
jgi:hypothetical protein